MKRLPVVIDERVMNSKGSVNIVEVLKGANRNKACSVSEILESVNYRKRNRLNRSNVLRVISNLEKYNSQILCCKIISGIKYYWLETNSTLKEKNTPATANIITQTRILNKSERDNKNDEKRHYEPTRKFLSSFPLNNFNYEYQIMGDTPLDKNIKFSNPDLIGVCKDKSLDSYHTVSVEVKDVIDKTNALVGFAQCCIYRTFSNYVIFACTKPKTDEQVSLVNRLCNLCSVYGIGFWIVNDANLLVAPKKNEISGNSELNNKIISHFLK
jgi:hypothetical protein